MWGLKEIGHACINFIWGPISSLFRRNPETGKWIRTEPKNYVYGQTVVRIHEGKKAVYGGRTKIEDEPVSLYTVTPDYEPTVEIAIPEREDWKLR